MVARKSTRKSKARKTAKKTSKSKARKTPAKTKAPESKAMRLTFSYDGDNVKLLSQQRADMIVPPSDTMKGYGKYKGFWAELKSASDKTLYRHVMHNPTKNDAEVFPGSPNEGISRVPAPKRKGVFVVVVPDTAAGEEVILCRSAPETKGPAKGIRALASAPAEEIQRFKLKK